MPNVFGHPSHVWYYHQWSLLLLLFLVWAAYVCCFLCGWDRSIADEVRRVLILLEDTSKAVKVFFCIRVHPNLKTILILKFLQTTLTSAISINTVTV